MSNDTQFSKVRIEMLCDLIELAVTRRRH